MTSPSPQNLKTMRALTAASADERFVQRAVAQLPIAVAEWETKLVQNLPADVKASLPTIKKIEAELASEKSLSSSDKAVA